MRLIKLETIVIDPERFRELDEDFLVELIESFKINGQIQPIVLDSNHKLIAGRHRLEAAKRLEWSEIRFEYYDSLDPLQQKIIEYEENDKRKQLSWQERARAIKEIHDLQQKAKGKTWSASDTARALGVSVGKVSEDLTLAGALDNARVAGRPTRRGALNTVKRERELVLVRELARRRAKDMGVESTHPSTSFTSGIIYNADCRQVIKEIKTDSVDLIIMDPPWGIDFDKASQWTKKWIATYDDSPNEIKKMLKELAPELYRVLKPGCHVYTFFPIQEPQWWIALLTDAGFAVRQRPLIWYKSGQAGISDVYTSFLPCYESILWGFKPGDDNVRKLFGRPIVEAQGWPRQPGIWHENEKPTDMLDRWIEASSEVNEVVLDCFSGGASTLASAYGLGRYFIGIEVSEVNYTKAVERMKGMEEKKENEEVETEDD